MKLLPPEFGVGSVTDSELAARAKEFAYDRHRSQPYGEVFHVDHLEMVVDTLAEFGWRLPWTVATAWLHDVVEDTETTFDEVERWFGYTVRSAVEFVTDIDGPREERKKDALRRYREWDAGVVGASRIVAGRIGARVKVADRLANLRYCRQLLLKGDLDERARRRTERKLAMYRSEHADFLEALGPIARADAKTARMFYVLGAFFE